MLRFVITVFIKYGFYCRNIKEIRFFDYHDASRIHHKIKIQIAY